MASPVEKNINREIIKMLRRNRYIEYMLFATVGSIKLSQNNSG